MAFLLSYSCETEIRSPVMIAKAIFPAIAAIILGACVATPRIEIPNKMSFNHYIPSQAPMSYADILCCYDCHV